MYDNTNEVVRKISKKRVCYDGITADNVLDGESITPTDNVTINIPADSSMERKSFFQEIKTFKKRKRAPIVVFRIDMGAIDHIQKFIKIASPDSQI